MYMFKVCFYLMCASWEKFYYADSLTPAPVDGAPPVDVSPPPGRLQDSIPYPDTSTCLLFT